MFSKRTDWFLEENSIARKIQLLKERGKNLIDLSESNPTHCHFQYPKEILAAFQKDKNLVYKPAAKGLLETRVQISEYYALKGIRVNPEQIIVTTGTSESYSYIFRLLANLGDTILSPLPSYPLLDYLADLNDIRLHPYSVIYDRSWKIRLEEMNFSNAKALIAIHPNNPTGSYLKKDELSKLNLEASANGLALISDEVFLDYELKAVPNRVSSLAQNGEVLTFTLSGISKILGLPQMKLGWIVVSGPNELVRSATERLEVIADTYLSVSTPIQNAFSDWISLQPIIQNEILSRIQSNLKILKRQVDVFKNCEVLTAEGGWYAVIKTQLLDEEKFILELLEKENICIQPGYFFGFEKPSFFVVSLLPDNSQFEIGIKKMLQFLAHHMQTTGTVLL